MNQIRLCFESVIRSWRHHLGLQITTLIVLSGALTVVSAAVLISKNLEYILVNWGGSAEMTLFLKENAGLESAENLRSEITTRAEVLSAKVISKQEARDSFTKQMAGYAPGLVDDAEFSEAFPIGIAVKFKSSQSDIYKDFLSFAQNLPGVDDISYGQEWVENYSAFMGVFGKLSWTLGTLLILAALLVVGNAVRESISQRSEAIAILELVGASNKMIRLPFLFEGLLMGFLSSCLALIATTTLMGKSVSNFLAIPGLSSIANHLQSFSMLEALTFILFGSLGGVLGSMATLSYVNDGWSLAHKQSRLR